MQRAHARHHYREWTIIWMTFTMERFAVASPVVPRISSYRLLFYIFLDFSRIWIRRPRDECLVPITTITAARLSSSPVIERSTRNSLQRFVSLSPIPPFSSFTTRFSDTIVSTNRTPRHSHGRRTEVFVIKIKLDVTIR